MATGGRWRTTRDLALLATLRLALSAVAWTAGFRAVSDDDFARVVHAQEWAHTPVLDPTGTSWLPFPFWLNGAVMLLFGTDLDVARATAWVLAILSTWLLYAAARLLLESPRDALLGAAIATALPWCIRLGVATVPELPTAALTLFAIATIAARRHQLLGALALLAATLSRYEPWPVAALFATLVTWDLVQPQAKPQAQKASASCESAAGRDPSEATPHLQTSDPSRRSQGPPRPSALLRPPKAILTAIIAALGPIAWITHNALTHGDPFRFAARVSAYQKAVGGTVDALAYPLSLFREEPELATLAAALALATLIRRRRARPHTAKPPAWRRTLPRATLLLATMLAALSFAALRGGAPTHHAGRAVLALWLAAALYVAPAIRAALGGPHRRPFALFVATLMPLGALLLRPWYSRLDDFTPRHDEVAIGRAAAALAAPSDRILIISPDYRHFAIQAATARPWTVLADKAAAAHREPTSNIVNIVVAHHSTNTVLGTPAITISQWAVWTPRDSLHDRSKALE